MNSSAKDLPESSKASLSEFVDEEAQNRKGTAHVLPAAKGFVSSEIKNINLLLDQSQ